MRMQTTGIAREIKKADRRSMTVCFVPRGTILEDNIEENSEKVEEGAQHDKDMEQLVEAEGFADVWLFQDIKDSADRVGDAACQQKGEGAAWHYL